MSEPLLLVSDVHLSHTGPLGQGVDLARLVRAHARHEIVLAGDVFDLSHDRPRTDPAASVAGLLARHTELRSALREHLSGGAAVTLIAGNHDAAVAGPDVGRRLLEELELQPGARLLRSSWFIRRDGLHVEHGHFYDPDNAPTHPLATWSEATEPLGIALTRRFLVPSGAWHFAHAHETTPLGGLARAFRLYGVRAPRVVAQYFATAIPLCARATLHSRFDAELSTGSGAVADFAACVGLHAELVEQLAALGARPTHHSFRGTFMRLYFDRILATLGLVGGASAALAVRSLVGAGMAAAAATYLGTSVRRSGSRYAGRVEERLRDAAFAISSLSEASLVVFGHSHREDVAPGYLNLGSFAYAGTAGRPYVVVDEHGRAERRHVPRAA